MHHKSLCEYKYVTEFRLFIMPLWVTCPEDLRRPSPHEEFQNEFKMVMSFEDRVQDCIHLFWNTKCFQSEMFCFISRKLDFVFVEKYF